MAETVLPLRVWCEERGGYPSRLEELVPGYLPRVPVDVFSGGPLVYRASENGYILYSVGQNGQDDGGVARSEEDRNADDIVVRAGQMEPESEPAADPEY